MLGFFSTCLVLWLTTTTAVDAASSPVELRGLVAWYEIESLHKRSRDGEGVVRWLDSSGNGHHLSATGARPAPVFRIRQLNGYPAVAVGRDQYLDVTDPFELNDHTLFLVYRAELTKTALFRDDGDPKHGVVLRHGGRTHVYQNGKEADYAYNRSAPLGTEFTITTLGRVEGALRAFVNGEEISSGLALQTPVRVGRFFHVEHTTYVDSDGEGLHLAEMIFYDRYLGDEERRAVTGHLADKFGIAIHDEAPERRLVEPLDQVEIDDAAVVARFGLRSRPELNGDQVFPGWDGPARIDGPFRLDPGSGLSEIHCSRDGTRVRLTLILSLRSHEPDARIRVMILHNGETYHAEEAISPAFRGPEEEKVSIVRFQTELSLDDGDYLQLLTVRAGAPGQVLAYPEETRLVLERVD